MINIGKVCTSNSCESKCFPHCAEGCLSAVMRVTEIDGVKYTDKQLEEFWLELGDIPIDPETEELEQPFLNFPIGTGKYDIWYWFDERHSKGVAWLVNDFETQLILNSIALQGQKERYYDN